MSDWFNVDCGLKDVCALSLSCSMFINDLSTELKCTYIRTDYMTGSQLRQSNYAQLPRCHLAGPSCSGGLHNRHPGRAQLGDSG